MWPMILGSGVYVLWLLAPVVVYFAVLRGPARLRAWRVQVSSVVALGALPAYIGLGWLASGQVWPPDIFFNFQPSRTQMNLADYRVEYCQEFGVDFYTTYYEVTDAAGQKAYVEIDGDAEKCWTFSAQQVGSRTYFLCNETAISDQTPYANTQRAALYLPRRQCLFSISELHFGAEEYRPASFTVMGEDVMALTCQME